MDTHYGEWLEIWSQLTDTGEQLDKLRMMTKGNFHLDYKDVNETVVKNKIYIPYNSVL